MLAPALENSWDFLSSKIAWIKGHYHSATSEAARNLSKHISLKPKDVWKRSVQVGNWSTLFVAAICYPTIIFMRGLDLDLLLGMVPLYGTFWGVMVLMMILIQITWVIKYCICQRFMENMLDFEVLDLIFGNDNRRLVGEDYSDYDHETDNDESSPITDRACG